MNAQAIAQVANFLSVSPNQIKRCEEWASVLFVIVHGRKPRFVSKKVVKMEVKSVEDRLIEAGGARWSKAGKDRIYFNDLERWYGLELSHYKTGNICSARFMGNPISNSEARRICSKCNGKLFWDVVARKWVSQDLDQAVASDVVLAIEVKAGV